MSHLSSIEIRQRFLGFFKERGHTVVPSSSLIPDDPSVLLTTAGMQQFKPYFVSKADPLKDFGSKNTASIQKCFRTSDIDEVGDETHLTFFEMLGNFSFDGYDKEKTIKLAHDFITKEMKLEIAYVSVLGSDEPMKRAPEFEIDEKSEKIWKSLGIKNVYYFGRKENFWGPTGNEGPCGPTTEIYVESSNGKAIEIWNIVFNEYYCNPDKSLRKLESPGVDTGMGLERLAMVVQNVPTIFDTDLFKLLLLAIPTENLRIKRVIADHIRGAVHLIADGVEPSNKDRGYILRRLLRRAAFHAIDLASEQTAIPLGLTTPKSWNERSSLKEVAALAIDLSYFKIGEKKDFILAVIDKEIGGFFELLKSRKELQELIREHSKSEKNLISGQDAFKLFSTFGIPIDYIRDEAAKSAIEVDLDGFETDRKKHQEVSRAGMEKKFGGHGLVLSSAEGLILNTGELKAGSEEELNKVLRLHTATHLLQRALREVLGPEVKQAGSDITPERTRFDFTFPRKLTPEEIKKAEDLVNQKIKDDLPVNFKEMPKEEAEKTGALYFFREKYPDTVKVYYLGEDIESAWSKEFCGGPHVERTGIIGHFKIVKEESVGAGVRRIRGVVE